MRIIKAMEEKYLLPSLELVEQVFTKHSDAEEGALVRRLVEEIRSKRFYLPELELIMVNSDTDEVIGYVNFARFHLDGKYENVLLLLSPVTGHSLCQFFQLTDTFLGSRPLGILCRSFHTQFGDFVIPQSSLLRQGTLTLGKCFQFFFQRIGAGFCLGSFLLQQFQSGHIAAASACNGLQFPLVGMDIFRNGIHQCSRLLGMTFGTEDIVLGLTELTLNGGQFKLHLRSSSGSFCQFRFLVFQFGGKVFFLLLQTGQFVGSVQNTRSVGYGTAGHRAAGIHDLTVQRDDLEAALILPCHSNGMI